nr:RNA-directed DNA polymerase, eukaryota [Tanacetum cinerariifolium]
MIGVEWFKGRMPTKIELTLEQSQQGVSYDILVAVCSSLRVLKIKCAQIKSRANKRSIINLIGHNVNMHLLIIIKFTGCNQRVLCSFLENLPEHSSDTKVLTMKIEILLETTSNKLLKDSNYLIHSYRVICFEMFRLVPAKSNSYYQAFNVKSMFGEIVNPKKSQVKLKCQNQGGIMVRNTSTIQDTNGWCWKFRNNKVDSSILIRNQFHKEVEKIASSFYIKNFPDYVDAKKLWVECQSYRRIVDAFIANKRSKPGKRQEKNEAFSKNNGDKTTNSIPSQQADNILEKLKVTFKGKVYMARAKELFTWTSIFLDHKESEYISNDESLHGAKNKSVGSQHGEDDLVDDSDVEGVSETFFGDKHPSPNNSVCNNSEKVVEQQSEDLFCIYDVLNKKPKGVAQDSDSSLSHPPGFTPEVMNNSHKVHENVTSNGESAFNYSHNAHNGGSILEVLEDMIRVKQFMGYAMEGCMKDIEHIIGTQGVDAIPNEYSLIKYSRSWSQDEKEWTWISNNSKVLIMVIYAPQSLSHKRVLWDYISSLIARWNGETIVMGDFNEVRSIDERFGSMFNQSSSRLFNHFITSSGLVDVKLGGYSFTWAHPSATKMSKLDHFLVSEGIISLFPSITALCLDSHLSNQWPILLREIHTDYGPIPFRFYHSWFKWDGFDVMVEQEWNSFSHSDTNGRNVSDEILLKRMELTRQLHDINQTEARDYVQKSKIKWTIEGDENSKFFHGIINKKHSQLSICGVFVGGDWNTHPEVVKDVFKDHFATRFKQPAHGLLKLNISFPNRLSTYQVADMDRSVSRDEIRVAVWNYGENKSPVLDGYTFKFFMRYWRFIASDLCSAVECFFESGSFSKGSNSSFIDLIPKVTNEKFVTDFRSISLIVCVYKVVTKILANRLTTVISDLVSDIQSAFVPNRQIIDGPFILNELLAWCKRKKKQAMIFKVDFAKAATSDGLFKGIQIQGSMAISHLFYSDDPVFIREWSDSNQDNIVKILKCFFLASGLKINIQKSQVLGVCVPRNIVNQAASLIRCAVMQNSFRCLEVMVGDSMSHKLSWADTVQKLRSRLSKLKVKTLSIG